jgi:malate dehydrogenase (oxaloacetate-decarboxylating)(NADP+)
VTDEMFAAAARALADVVSTDDLERGRIFPPLQKIREVSLVIAQAVARMAFDTELATVPEPEDLETFIRDEMFEPVYRRLT